MIRFDVDSYPAMSSTFRASYITILFLWSLFPTSICSAQQADSLISQLPVGIGPKEKADTLNQLGFGLIFTDPIEARLVFNEAIKAAENSGYVKGEAVALKNKGISHDVQGNSNQAVIFYQESLVLLESLNDTLGISRIKNNLGIAYKNLNDLETARRFYDESIRLKNLLGDIRGVSYGLNNIGEIYQRLGNNSEALNYFTRSYSILDSINDDRGRSITLSNLGISNLEMGKNELAINYLRQSMKIDEVLEDYYSISYSYILLGKAYLNTNQLARGLDAIGKAETLAKEISALKVYYDSQVVKAQLLKRTNQLTDLANLYEHILVLSDSLAQLNLVEETAKMNAIYESREKERLIQELESESILNEQLITTQKRAFRWSLVAVVLLILLLIIVYGFYRKVGAKNIELKIKIKERDAAKEEAEHANQAKSQFLAQMSHEIRTPLNAIIGYTDQIMETDLQKPQRKHLEIVNESALGLLGIINGILDLSKLEAGKLELIIEPTDLIELCDHVVQMTSFRASQKNLDLKLVPVDKKYQYVLADDTRLRQVLVNLLANAVKFTEEGEIELKIEVIDESSSEKSLFRFSVRDTGIGIKPENMERIFHAFSQEDVSTTRKYGGTGLGLSISNTLLSLMDSELKVVSTPNEGSTFSFEVPLMLTSKPKEKSNTLKEENDKVVSEDDRIKVLVAEDNATNMVLVKMMLKKALPNAKIIEVENGQQAVHQFDEEQPDIILMDVQMPEMDGYTASREIRKKETGQRTPIVAITAGSMTADKEKCYEAGMDDFISKPIINDALTLALRKWLAEK